MKKFVHYLLIAIFFFVYVRIIIFMNIGFDSSVGVLVGSVVAGLLSLLLAIVTTNKIIEVLSR